MSYPGTALCGYETATRPLRPKKGNRMPKDSTWDTPQNPLSSASRSKLLISRTLVFLADPALMGLGLL
jgi:hypothetical protein